MVNVQSAGNPFKGDWKWMMAFGVILVLLGIFAVTHPLATALSVSLMFAIALMIGGVFSLVTGVMGKGLAGRWADILFGILAIIAAVLTFRAPLSGAMSLVYVLGALYAASGFMELFGAFSGPREGRGWAIALGVFDVLLGFWIMFLLPSMALLTLAFFVGLGFIIRGVFLAVFSLQLRKVTG